MFRGKGQGSSCLSSVAWQAVRERLLAQADHKRHSKDCSLSHWQGGSTGLGQPANHTEAAGTLLLLVMQHSRQKLQALHRSHLLWLKGTTAVVVVEEHLLPPPNSIWKEGFLLPHA